MSNFFRPHSLIVVAYLLFALVSCSGTASVKPSAAFDAEQSFTRANKLIDDAKYTEARTLLLEIKNRDLSKKYAPLAQLRIADSYLREEEPELAVAEYRKFLEIYPDHKHASYAQYQLAMIYFNRIEGYERGYGDAAKALAEFEKLKRDFPRNPYRDVVELRMEKCRNIIADYEIMVGEYYLDKGNIDAAINRFEGLLKTLPASEREEKVLFNLALAYKKSGKKEKAAEYLQSLLKKYPTSPLAAKAKKELSWLDAGKK